jgi:hypothetical protein
MRRKYAAGQKEKSAGKKLNESIDTRIRIAEIALKDAKNVVPMVAKFIESLALDESRKSPVWFRLPSSGCRFTPFLLFCGRLKRVRSRVSCSRDCLLNVLLPFFFVAERFRKDTADIQSKTEHWRKTGSEM